MFAICDDDDDGRLESPCRDLPNGRRAVFIGVDCATAIDAALQGFIDVIVVDWRGRRRSFTSVEDVHRRVGHGGRPAGGEAPATGYGQVALRRGAAGTPREPSKP